MGEPRLPLTLTFPRCAFKEKDVPMSSLFIENKQGGEGEKDSIKNSIKEVALLPRKPWPHPPSSRHSCKG